MHLRDNFNEGGPVSQVPASWFNRVAKFINNLIPGEGVTLEKHDDGTPSIINIVNSGGGEPGAPVEAGSFPDDNVEQEEEVLWNRGDTDEGGKLIGANLMLVFKGEDDGNHLLYAAKLEIDPDGRISKIVAVENSGLKIYA